MRKKVQLLKCVSSWCGERSERIQRKCTKKYIYFKISNNNIIVIISLRGFLSSSFSSSLTIRFPYIHRLLSPSPFVRDFFEKKGEILVPPAQWIDDRFLLCIIIQVFFS